MNTIPPFNPAPLQSSMPEFQRMHRQTMNQLAETNALLRQILETLRSQQPTSPGPGPASGG